MSRSPLGFHTLTLFLRLTRKEAEQLIKHFYKYCKQTGQTRMFMPNVLPEGQRVWREYIPKFNGNTILLPLNIRVGYPDEDHGIKWELRFDRHDEAYKEYLIEVTINPKILGGIHDYILSTPI